jgi:hypothetical protein
VFRMLAWGTALALLFLLSSAAPAGATSYTVTAALYHPDGSSTVNNLLTCGWHNNCTYGPDHGQALDWVPANSSVTTTWVRLWVVGGGSSAWWAARQETYYQELPCKEMRSDIERVSDWALYGSVLQYHSGGNPNHAYGNVYASTGGVYNEAVAGYILDHSLDNCSSTGNHTHQFYQSGPSDLAYWKNTQISSTCNLCMTPYQIWTTNEYAIQFVTS